MRLKKLTLKNIRSYESAEITFPFGSFLLSGDVGVGKTTILLAIEYSFFGLQPGQKGSALLRNNAETGEVSLEFEVDGKSVLIERKLRRNKTSVTNDSANITIDGESEPLSLTEVKSKILDLLGYPSEFIRKNNLLFRYTVYTPQEQMKQIILEDIETRLNVLRHVLGIDKYKRMRNNAQILTANLKEQIQKMQAQTFSLGIDRETLVKLKSQIEAQEEKIFSQKNELISLTKKRIEAESSLAETENKVRERESLVAASDKTTFMISSKKEILAGVMREAYLIEKKLNSELSFKSNPTQLSSLRKRFSELDSSAKILQTELSDCTANLRSIAAYLSSLSKKRERVFSLTICSTCLQTVPDSHKYNILNDVEREIVENNKTKQTIESRENELNNTLSSLRTEIERVSLEIKELETAAIKEKALSSLKEALAEKGAQANQINQDLIMLQAHYSKLREEVAAFSKHISANTRALESLSTARQAEKSCEITLEKLRTTKDYLSLEFDALSKSIKEKEAIEGKAKALSDLYSWLENSFITLLSFTERNVLLKLRSEFAKFFSKWFKLLIVAPELDVQLDENFTPLILQGDVEMDYSFLSGGERTAIALAYRLALNQIINSLFSKMKTRDIIILDEPTDGFSEAQLDRMRDIFSEINAKQLILVSHEQKIEGFVDNVLKLNKKEGASQIDSEISSDVTAHPKP